MPGCQDVDKSHIPKVKEAGHIQIVVGGFDFPILILS